MKEPMEPAETGAKRLASIAKYSTTGRNAKKWKMPDGRAFAGWRHKLTDLASSAKLVLLIQRRININAIQVNQFAG